MSDQDRMHLAPPSGDSHLRKGVDLQRYQEGHERIFGAYRPTGSQAKRKQKDLRFDATNTCCPNVQSDDYRANYDGIFKK